MIPKRTKGATSFPEKIATVKEIKYLPDEVYESAVQITGENYISTHGGQASKGTYPRSSTLIDSQIIPNHGMKPQPDSEGRESSYDFNIKRFNQKTADDFEVSFEKAYDSSIGYFATHGGHIMFVDDYGELYLAPRFDFILDALKECGYRGGHEMGPINLPMGIDWIALEDSGKQTRLNELERQYLLTQD